MDWFILGIEPTKDKKAITAAYRQKLRQTNPEDKPEEFKSLRTAYEEAMRLADAEEPNRASSETPMGQWVEALEKLYEDYASRIKPDCWKKLLYSDVCIGLDTRPAAEEALLKFLMEHFYIPQAVWIVLDESFAFSERTEELYEILPREFVDHAILSGIRQESGLDYELFIPGISGSDCDTYRKLYFQAMQMPLQEAGAVLEQMDTLPEKHPYGEALRFRFYMATGKKTEGEHAFARLAAEYPDNSLLVSTWAEICLENGAIDEAERLARHIVDLDSKYIGAKEIYARCLAAKKKYHEAKECAYEVIHSCGDNPVLAERMAEFIKNWNEQLIHEREDRYMQIPTDWDNAIELAWCYAQNDRVDEAFALAAKIDPDYEDAFAYHNLMGKLFHNTGKFEQALAHLQTVVDVLRGMVDDGTAETRKRIIRLPEMLQVQGNCLMQLGRNEEAKAKFEEALSLAPEDTEVLSLMGRILYACGEYDQAVEMLQRLRRLSPDAWFTELLLAMCLYQLHRDREAFDTVNCAISAHGNDLGLYILKMQILLRNELYDEVHEILDFLKESGAPEDISLDFIRAELTELEKKDTKSALQQYCSLQKRVEAGENLMWNAELYFHLAVLTGNQKDLSHDESRNAVLQLIDNGLVFDALNTDLLGYKAWVLKQGGLYEDAVEMYRKVAEKNPNSAAAIRGIADLYYEDLQQHAADALSYYEKLLEAQKTAELYFYAATCKRHLGDMEGARIYYLKELEMDPDDMDGYRGLAFVAEYRGEYEQSLTYLERALEIMADCGRSFDWMIEHKAKVLRRLGRWEDALRFAQEAAERYHYSGTFRLQHDICCQFGLWERAQQVLSVWKRANRNDPDLMAAGGKLNLLQGKMFKAVLAMGPAKHKLPFEQVQDFRLQLADLEHNHDRKIQIWSRRVKNDPEDSYALINLAHAYWYAGKQDVARGAARRALVQLDKTLSQNLTDATLYRTRRCLALAILGRADEAREELARCRSMPLCEFCEYCRCKDADIYEAFVEEVLGNSATALDLFSTGKANWPDELDFISGENRLKKGKRKC